MFHERISLNVVLLLLVNFVIGFRLELMFYIPHCKYQGKPHLSLWFPAAARGAAIVHRNHCLFVPTEVNFRI